MDFTINQLLKVVGRLDDSPGFDTPRERFRRLLQQRMIGVDAARLIVQECRERSGEQSHRALQDTVVLCGRLLGFEAAFGRYQHDPGAVPFHGTWHARRRLHVTLVLCTDQTPDISLETIARALGEQETEYAHVALLVVTPRYAAKDRLEQTFARGKYANLQLVTLRGLLRLCGMVADRMLAFEDVLQVLHPAETLDGALDLLERVAATVATAGPHPAVASGHVVESNETRYWINVMRPDAATPLDYGFTTGLATRQALEINPAPGLEDRVRAGDGICVFVVGHGVVAHARISAVVGDGGRARVDRARVTQVLRLGDLNVYTSPVVVGPDLSRKLVLALTDDEASVMTPISRREFESVTAQALLVSASDRRTY